MNEALPLAALGVLLVRPGVLVVASPVFGGQFVPVPVRLALTAVLAVLMMPLVAVPAGLSSMALAAVVAGEAIIGFALAFSIRAIVAGAELAGHVAGFQIGMSYAALVDPQTGVRNNLTASLYASLATIVFFAINGHHAMLRALTQSYRALPPGQWHVADSTVGTVTRILGLVFLLGVQLAMPVVIVLLLVELALGLVSRVAPALNLMVFGFPIRVSVGLLALAAGIAVVPEVVRRYAPAALEAASRLAGLAP